MGWSYDSTLSTDKDQVRLMVGDTDEDDPQMSDEEIDTLLSLYGAVRATAVAVCRALAAKFSRKADKWVGDLKILASQKARAYLELADRLEKSSGPISSAAALGTPSAGGVYAAEKEVARENTLLVQPYFSRGMMDNEC